MNNNQTFNYKGAIFDMDGTLLDSMFLWDIACNKYLTDRQITPEDNLAEKFKTMTLTEAAHYYRERYGITDSVEKICDDINAMIHYAYTHDVVEKPGALNFVKSLYEKGVKLYVASATDTALVKDAFTHAGLIRYFDGFLSTQDTGISKRDSHIYDLAVQKMGLTKNEVHIFEDSFFAIKTCVDAGYRVTAMDDISSKDDVEQIKSMVDRYIY